MSIHIGIERNEITDRPANAALKSATVELDMELELGDEFPAVDRFELENWQEEWDRERDDGASYRGLEPRVDRREILRNTSVRITHCGNHDSSLEIRKMCGQRGPARHARHALS